MDEIGVQPQEASDAGEAAERTETQALDSATYDPRTSVEQVGDYRQAEAIQSAFMSLLETANAVPSDESLQGSLPDLVEGPFEPTPAEGGHDPAKAIPITLPGSLGTGSAETNIPRSAVQDGLPSPVASESPVQTGESITGEEQVEALPNPIPRPDSGSVVEQVGGMPDPIPQPSSEFTAGKEQVGALPNPIPQPSGESTTGEEQVGAMPNPIPRPAEEIGIRGYPKEQVGAAEIPFAGTAGETGFKEQVGVLPIPLPHPAEGLQTGEDEVVIDQMVTRAQTSFPGMFPDDPGAGINEPGNIDAAGFDAVTNYIAGFRNSGGPAGNAGTVESPGSTTGSSSQPGFVGSDSKPNGHESSPESSGKTEEDIRNAFINYCKDAYDNGDRPEDGDVTGWVSRLAADFFEGQLGSSGLIDILRGVGKDETGTKAPTITVTRVEEDDDPEDDDPEDENPEDDDPEDDDDDDGDDDDGDGDEGDDGDGDGDNDVSEEEGDDTGHRQPGIDPSGGIPSAEEEKDDTGKQFGVEGGRGGSSGSGGSDDTGGKETMPLGGGGKIHPDSGGNLPIDPDGVHNAGDAANLKQQTGKG